MKASHFDITNKGTNVAVNKWEKNKFKTCLTYIRNDMSILDIGCSTCSFFSYLQENKINIKGVGFDTDKKALEIANAKGCDVYDSLEKIMDSFDVITMWEVIEHLQLEEFLVYLDYIKKHLKMDGKLIISTPNILNPFYPFWAEPTHIRPYSLISLSRILESKGFKIVYRRKTHPLKHPVKILFCLLTSQTFYAKLAIVAELQK